MPGNSPTKQAHPLREGFNGVFFRKQLCILWRATMLLLSRLTLPGLLPSLQPRRWQEDNLHSTGESKGTSRHQKIDPDFVEIAPWAQGTGGKKKGLNMGGQSGTIPAWCIFATSDTFRAKCTF